MTFPERKKKLLAYAFDQARKAGKVFWNYIDGIYKNLGFRGISCVEEAQEYEYDHGPKQGW